MKGYANSQLLVTPSDLSRTLSSKSTRPPLLLDMRPPEDYTAGHIPGA
ncbi:MAG: rhodanese-like domain-containing protein, partial [Acidobacteria bacterium]|nr:rhodanese-like domain-containing protein [Acidobacteriota bacterium]